MLLNIIRRSFVNQRRAMFLMIISVSVGTALAASLISLSLEIGGKVSRELRSFGANILIEPKVEGLADISGQRRYLRQEDIIKAKTIFWRHNIVGISPFLETDSEVSFQGRSEEIKLIGAWYEKDLPQPGESKKFQAGIKTVSPWWQIEGAWPASKDKVVLGASVAGRFGIRSGEDIVMEGENFTVSGILETGGMEDDQIFMDMEALQELNSLS